MPVIVVPLISETIKFVTQFAITKYYTEMRFLSKLIIHFTLSIHYLYLQRIQAMSLVHILTTY